MNLKVGDKVKDFCGLIGVIEGIAPYGQWPYYVKLSDLDGVGFHNDWPGFDVFGLHPRADYELELVE
ncbi:hypothetical protein UFOVP59_39 [uncultured Caudovirales phage]|uniref:Uncharacterized protein n=1 Tax=uncultured Caudovirales phage TaxID=2100421 RepID=A0A6J7WW26_9CAUD|nr:hypothetical protein UFOVP59_39 [uncultured Caudovirales phage]CAB5221055.1 hypothetical protein UFOVP246_76 [uncultured Caudovirales phage]